MDKIIDVFPRITDLTYLKWSQVRSSSGTAGSFLKAYDDSGKLKKYYKLSDFDSVYGIIGHECINEIITQRILRLLDIDHLEYRLLHANVNIENAVFETWLCESDSFRKSYEKKLTLEDHYNIEKLPGETPMDFCKRKGWEKTAADILITDFLILNRDRHGANIEVLLDNRTKKVRPAPLFDHGLSFLCRCHNTDDIHAFDVTEDKKVQAFLGSSSTKDNLNLIPVRYINDLPHLDESIREDLFVDLEDILSKDHLDKIWEMFRRRWIYLDNLRDKR